MRGLRLSNGIIIIIIIIIIRGQSAQYEKICGHGCFFVFFFSQFCDVENLEKFSKKFSKLSQIFTLEKHPPLPPPKKNLVENFLNFFFWVGKMT
jgi:hypothetical protein